MYQKLRNLLIEGLSGASKHYLLLNRRLKTGHDLTRDRAVALGIAKYKVKKKIPQSAARAKARGR